jgi:hypothetical protein
LFLVQKPPEAQAMVKMRTKEKGTHHEGLSISYTRERKTRPQAVHGFIRRLTFLRVHTLQYRDPKFQEKLNVTYMFVNFAQAVIQGHEERVSSQLTVAASACAESLAVQWILSVSDGVPTSSLFYLFIIF